MAHPLVCLAALLAGAPGDFDVYFAPTTLRFDYYHSGTAAEEHVSLDGVRTEGDWAGSRTRLIDRTNLGKYLFVVLDSATNQQIYSRGFSSIYGEWETIGEARKGVWRTFHESQRFPEPKSKFQVVLKKRADDGSFREIFTVTVDPKSRFLDRSAPQRSCDVKAYVENGPAEKKLDILILGDGYRADERAAFDADVERLIGVLFDTEPFRARRDDFNVRGAIVPSARSGISNPRQGVWNDTALGLSFNAFDLDRYVLTYANFSVRRHAASAPYDTLILLANSKKYGGGGIFNLWATCAARAGGAPYVFVHELGHSLGGLADEYYSSAVAYEEFTKPGVEPWEPNITALLDPSSLKWADVIEAGTPIPTPWERATYDRVCRESHEKRRELVASGAAEEEMAKLLESSAEEVAPLLNEQEYRGKVGAFEGAGYQAKGLYRPEVDCIMFSRNRSSFCRVCSDAIERAIDLATD